MTDEEPDWRTRGACRDYNGDLWFDKATYHGAKRICRTLCEVRAACLEWALEHQEWGVFGGLDPKERNRLRRERRRPA